jgi:hypothetical protein
MNGVTKVFMKRSIYEVTYNLPPWENVRPREAVSRQMSVDASDAGPIKPEDASEAESGL